MVRVPPSEKPGLKKGPWTPEEDQKLINYIQSHEHCSWRIVPKQAGLARCGKSCRLRWTNYLRPGIKRGSFSAQEESTIIQLHAALGNRWSTISTHLPGRTDNEIKNHWNTRLRKRLLKMGIDPTTHRPLVHHQLPFQPSSINTSVLLSLLQGTPSAADVNASLANALLLGSNSSMLSFLQGSASTRLFPAASGHVLQNNPMSSAPGAPPSSSVFPPPAALDPALLAAAEIRLVLDCLKFNNAEIQPSTSDHRLNQLLTRLLMIKLLQGYTNAPPPPPNPYACHASKTPIHNMSQHPATDHVLRNQGHHQAGSIPVPAAAPEPPSAYLSSISCSELSENSLPTTSMILNMFSSSYQQRLLQALPFLAESMIEPCTSAATADHLSSATSPNQISQASFLNCPAELSTPNGSLTSQQTKLWPAGGKDNEALPSGGGRGGAGVTERQSVPPAMASVAQLLAGAGVIQGNDSGPQTLMTWEEHLMSQQKRGERDLASSSTVSSSTMSSASQCHATPNTPTGHNVHIQDYWSDLLNLINSTKYHSP